MLSKIKRPYKLKFSQSGCRYVNLEYDFITDMLVLEFALDHTQIDTQRERDSNNNLLQ